GTYFETLTREPDGSIQVGGLVGPRVELAFERLVANQEYIPLDQFILLGQDAFNARERVYLHYQEAITLAIFFMQAQDGKYREGFLDYLVDAYKGRLRRGIGRSLEDRVGVRYKALDTEFLDYLTKGVAPRPAE